jgi:excisionase family DNA binding protein
MEERDRVRTPGAARAGPHQEVQGMSLHGDSEVLLTPAEVASLFRVDPKTVTRWAKAGKLSSIRTLGGHRRYKESEVRALLGAASEEATPDK